MKKILFITFFVFLFLPLIAWAEVDSSGYDDWGAGVFDNGFAGQKQITDEDFEKTMQQLENKKNAKQIKKQKKMGQMLKPGDDTKMKDAVNELPVLNIPVTLLVDDKEIIPGHYQIRAEKKNGKICLYLFQARQLIVTIPAVETNNDFEDVMQINFVRYRQFSQNQIIIEYGSLEYNAYALINFKVEEY